MARLYNSQFNYLLSDGRLLSMTALRLLTTPKLAAILARRGWGAHLLDIASIRRIVSEDFR
jgi:hypothetical protein